MDPRPIAWRHPVRLSIVGLVFLPLAALADSAVVFNEIMYHPAGTNEAALEWVELYNQHAVDLDLSGWRLDGGIDFDFAEGTILRGGRFLVVASAPTNFTAATGATNVVGPFRNRLSNASDTLRLRNNDSRVLDELTYGSEGDWPVAPDGAGPSLMKRAANLLSRDPANWRASYEPGGTPGRANIPGTATNGYAAAPAAIAFNEFSSATNTNFWVEVINHGATNFDLGGCVLARFGGATNREFILPPTLLAPGALRQWTRAELGFGADPGDRLVLYASGGSNVLDALVAKREPRARRPDGTGRWGFPTILTPAASNVIALREDVVINEILYHAPPFPAVAPVFTNELFVQLTNEWRWFANGGPPPGTWNQPAYDDFGWATGRGLFLAPTNLNVAVPKGTRLPLTNELGQRIVTFYFRAQFSFLGATNGLTLTLRPAVDDGAVFYLNGVEIHRFNLPATNILYGTLALTNVGLPAFNPSVTLPITSLAQGVNTLAVEVHQVVPNSSDAAFGCELLTVRQLSPGSPFHESDESWVELHNRGSNAVNLTGWRLDEGIDFRFPSNHVIAPGGYLVVAKDPVQMLALYPSIDVLGPFTNQLSRNGELLALKDANNNLADEVRYYAGGRWPETADAGGSSLELRDPRADNANPEAWAASDERAASPWQTYTFRGLSTPAQPGEPTLWHEFALGLLDGAGEVWLDDISVVESPAGVPIQLIRDGGFDSGSAARWRFLGNHRHSRVERELGAPNNFILRLIATGAAEYQGNQVEATLTNNTSIVDGREYEISFRAKWVSGKNLLNTRLYFNRLARTAALPRQLRRGTPGAPNSQRAPNLGPTFDNLAHSPVVPNALQPVAVSVVANDPDGFASMTLRYSVNGAAWQSASMAPNPSGSSGATSRRFTGTVPGQPAAAIVQFFVEGRDSLGALAFAPAGGTNSRALYTVQDNRAVSNGLHNFRLVLTLADGAYLHTATNTLSNELLGSTVIYDELDVYYDVGVRLKGSFVGRNVDRVGFHCQFPDDRLFRGEHRIVSVDRSQHTLVGGVGEIVIKHIAAHAGGIPSMYDDLARFIHPSVPTYTSMSSLRLTGFDGDWLDAQFRDGAEGEVFEVEVLRWSTMTVDGNPESPKQVNSNNNYANLEVQDYGDGNENYRWFLLKVNNRTEDDFAGGITWCKTLGLSGTNFDAQAARVMDVDQWLRVLAYQSLVGPGDAYYTGANIHNFRVYVRPGDGKVLYLPWDWDSAFQAGAFASLFGGGNIAKLLVNPHNHRQYLSHLNDLVRTTYNSTYMSRWTAHYSALSGQDFSGILNYISTRANFVLGQLPTAAFAITNNGGNNFTVTNGVVTLGGTGPLTVNEIYVNGVAYPVTWISDTRWRITVPLAAGTTTLAVTTLDQHGRTISNAVDTITVTNSGPPALLPVVINEWMADNAGPDGLADPMDELFQDWFELFNPNNVAVNLAGYYLTDNLSQPTKFVIPAPATIAPHGFLLVWADEDGAQNAIDPSGARHANFKLSGGGEALGLFHPNGVTPQHALTFGEQFQNVSQGLFPDGNTNAVTYMTQFTPGAANLPTLLEFTGVSVVSNSVTLRWDAQPGQTYQLQFKDRLSDPNWTPLSIPFTAPGPSATATDSAATNSQRFYKVVLSQ